MNNNTQGIMWALVAGALFSVTAAMAKIAVTEYHVLQILFFRQLVVLLSSLPSIANTFPQSLKTRNPGLHAVRLIGAFIALTCGIWAVAVLPLTTAVTLGFTQVFFLSILSSVFLKEVIGVHRIAAVIAGFTGVLIAMRPGVEGLINLHATIPIIGALGAAIAIISVRTLSQTESTATLLVYQSVFIGAIAGVSLFWFWNTPDLSATLLLFTMGIFAAAGQWTGVMSLRLGEASVVGNIEYIKIVYAAICGFVLFQEVPDSYTLLGAAFIIGSAAYLLHRERLKKAKVR